MNLIIAYLAIFLLLAAGFMLTVLITGDKITLKAELYAVSFGLGTGLVFLEMFIASWYGIHLTTKLFYIALFVNIVLLYIFSAKKLHKRKLSLVLMKKKTQKFGFVEVFLILVIIFNIALTLVDALALPMKDWDAVAIWSYKAKIIYYESIKSAGYFTDPTKSYSHPDYPLMVPFMQAYIYTAIGHVDDRLARLIFFSYYFFLLLFVYSLMSKSIARNHALFFTALFATLPALLNESVSGYSDLPLAFYYFPMAAYLYLFIKEGRSEHLALSAVFSALCVFAKNEGMALLLINLAVLAGFFFSKSREGVPALHGADRKELKKPYKLRQLFYYTAAVLLIISPWLIFRRNITVIQEDYFSQLNLQVIIGNLPRIPLILSSFVTEFADFKSWNILWIILVVLALFNIEHLLQKPLVFLNVLFLAHLCLYVIIYVITPWEPQILIKTTISRLLIHLAPIAVFLCAELFSSGTRYFTVSNSGTQYLIQNSR